MPSHIAQWRSPIVVMDKDRGNSLARVFARLPKGTQIGISEAMLLEATTEEDNFVKTMRALAQHSHRLVVLRAPSFHIHHELRTGARTTSLVHAEGTTAVRKWIRDAATKPRHLYRDSARITLREQLLLLFGAAPLGERMIAAITAFAEALPKGDPVDVVMRGFEDSNFALAANPEDFPADAVARLRAAPSFSYAYFAAFGIASFLRARNRVDVTVKTERFEHDELDCEYSLTAIFCADLETGDKLHQEIFDALRRWRDAFWPDFAPKA